MENFVANGDLIISDNLISWFKFADLHFISTRITNDSITQQYCDYFSTTFDLKKEKKTLTPVRKTFAFILEQQQQQQHILAEKSEQVSILYTCSLINLTFYNI